MKDLKAAIEEFIKRVLENSDLASPAELEAAVKLAELLVPKAISPHSRR